MENLNKHTRSCKRHKKAIRMLHTPRATKTLKP